MIHIKICTHQQRAGQVVGTEAQTLAPVRGFKTHIEALTSIVTGIPLCSKTWDANSGARWASYIFSLQATNDLWVSYPGWFLQGLEMLI